MSTINARRKGKRGELDFVKALKHLGFGEARRTQQHSGIGGRIGDVEVPGLKIHFEVKRVAQLNVQKAMDQAERDSKDGFIPVVAHRRDNEPWKLTFYAADLHAFLHTLAEHEAES